MNKLPREYVLIPKEEYEALTKALRTESDDAIAYGRASLAQDLLAARKAAELTQAELARRLRISQPLVSQAEQGKVKVGERYVASVLKACGLPSNWAPKPAAPKMAYPRKIQLAAAKALTVKEGRVHVHFERATKAFAAKPARPTFAAKRARGPKASARRA
jgi:transcriptional regulator with XRE-family HTH domain